MRKFLVAGVLVLGLAASIDAVAEPNGNGAGLVLSTSDNWSGADVVNGNGAYLITMGTVEGAETITNGLGAMLTLNPPFALISRGEVPPELCGLFPLDTDLSNFYAAFGIEDEGLVDLVGLGLPVEFAVALVEFACENDADFASAASNAFLLNRTVLQPLVTMDNALKGHVKVFSILGLLSDAMGTELIQLLEAAGVETLGLELTPVVCDEVECLPALAKTGGDGFEVFDVASKQVMNAPFSANGNYDGDDFSNLDEAMNVLDMDGGVAEFVIAATNPDLNGTEGESMGCGAAGMTPNQDVDTTALLPLALAIAALVALRRRVSR